VVAAAPNHLLVRRAGLISLLLTAALGVAIWLIFYPGIMSYDSLMQYNQARAGEFTTWHPPILAMTLALIMRLGLDIGSLMLIQCLVGILGIRQALLNTIEFLIGQRTARTYWAATGLTLAILSPLTPTTFYLMTFWKDCWTAFLLLWSLALSLKLFCEASRLSDKGFSLRLAVLIAVMALAALPRHNTLVAAPVLGLLLWRILLHRGIRRAWPAIALPLLIALAVESGLEFHPRVLKTYPGNHVEVMDLLGICVRFPQERIRFPYVCSNMYEGIDRYYTFGDITPIATIHRETINVDLLTDSLHPALDAEYKRAILGCPMKLLYVKFLAFARLLDPASQGSSYFHREIRNDTFGLQPIEAFSGIRDAYASAVRATAQNRWTRWITWHAVWFGVNLVLLAMAARRGLRHRAPGDLYWFLVLLVPAAYTLSYFLASVALYYRYLYPSTLLVQVLAVGSICSWLSRDAGVRREG
jgi:hypothetical protein